MLVARALLTFPRSRSHIRCEIGKSISLLSTMLLAMKVPARRNMSVICVISVGFRDLISHGLGNNDPSCAPVYHILPSPKSLILRDSSVKYSYVGPKPVPASPLKLMSRDLRFSNLSIMRIESVKISSRLTCSYCFNSLVLPPPLRSSR